MNNPPPKPPPVFRSGNMVRLPNGEFISFTALNGTLDSLQAMAEEPHYWPALQALQKACCVKDPSPLSQKHHEIIADFGLLIKTVEGIPESVAVLVRNALMIQIGPDGEIESVEVLSKQKILPPPKKH